jgi:O-antigen/teichoic acid export membrane protein
VVSGAVSTDAAAPAGAPPAPAADAAPLRARMLRAAGWLVGSNVSSQAVRLASNLALTRLLVPEAFGLVAAVNTLYFALVMFSDLGVWQSIVRSDRGDDPRFLGTAWTVQLARGGLLFAVVLAVAFAVRVGAGAGVFAAGTVYTDPRLPAMIAVFAACALLQGAESMNLATAQRDLRGAALARLELISQLAAIATTLALAWSTRSVWSLLAGSLAGTVARTALSHVALPGCAVRPRWDAACAREILGFGKWVFASSIVGFLAAHGEKVILGGTLSTASFGVFSIAATLVAAVAGVYGSLNGHVVFSSLSIARRSDRAELQRVYARVQQLSDVFLGVVGGGLATAGQWVVWALYDARYQDAGWMLQWLGLGLVAMRHQVVEQLMFANGRAARVSANNLLRALSLAVLIPAGFALAGERGAIAAVVASQFAGWPSSLLFKREQGLLTWATERWWIPALALGLALGALVDFSFGRWVAP